MLHATFGPGTFRELYEAFRAAERARGLAPSRHGLPLDSAKTWLAALEDAGLAGIRCESAQERVDYSGCRSILEAIRATGASHGSPDAARSVRLVLDAIEIYDGTYRSAGGVFATYDLLYLEGARPA